MNTQPAPATPAPIAAAGQTQSMTGMGDVNMTVSIAELAGLDMGDVEAKRFGAVTPIGAYRFQIEAGGLEQLGDHIVAKFVCKITVVHGVADPELEATALVGNEHQELFFVKDLDSLGYLKQFMLDIGMTASGPLQQLLGAAAGISFDANVQHRKDKNDTSRIYTKLVNIIPAAG